MSKPAARVGDMHTCPMATPGTPPVPHVGGPILPPGVPTVLIGGMPAAVLGAMCTCVGPPDSVVMGSTGVFIGGSPAARMGDSTGHGGVITVGCPTVLIGESGSSGLIQTSSPCGIMEKIKPTPSTHKDAVDQEALQQDLKAAILQNLDQLPEKDRQKAIEGLAAYTTSKDAAEMAALSVAVYGDHTFGDCGKAPCGFEKVDTKKVYNIDEGFMNGEPEKSGFKAAVYKTPKGETVLAFAGTEDGADVKSDLIQGAGYQDPQYDRAILLGRKMKSVHGPDGFRTTGHSLGGGLASATSAISGARGTTINPAGLHPDTTRRLHKISDEEREKNELRVTAYHNSHDPLNRIQNNRKKTLAGVMGIAIWLFGPIGLLYTGKLAYKGALPSAYGSKVVIQSKKKGLLEHGSVEMMELMEDSAMRSLDSLKNLFKC